MFYFLLLSATAPNKITKRKAIIKTNKNYSYNSLFKNNSQSQKEKKKNKKSEQ